MRRFLIVLTTLAVFSAPTWADNVEFDVNAWATINAPTTCKSNCTETIDVSFLWMGENNPLLPGYGEAVPGSASVKSSGFLGTFPSSDAGSGGLFT
jgi:hypothetical protein